ncbi:MAG: hypothetical protein E7470_03320 [Ruminococcaceae bacterium]|nr:hypothetical protein [Oscillospiraceae bacterium]
MNLKIKALLIACLIFSVLILASGCVAENTPYDVNDADNYKVSVKFDANGGIFTTNTSVIVDSFNLSELPVGSDGKAQIALIAPDHPARGNDAFTAINNGYFLAGWYANRTETLDADGKTTYVYSDKWDFEADTLSVDADGTYTSAQPVLTLYAAWIPLFEIEFYDLTTGDYLESYVFNPTQQQEILIPQWSTETGGIEMHDFPKKSGWTFEAVYADAAGTQPLSVTAVKHPGVVDEVNGMAKDHVMKLYVDFAEGEWYHIYNVEQFLDHASVNASFVIHEDLDFEGQIWPSSLMHGNYSGQIRGNGHTFSNITFEQTNNSKVNSGLFGNLTETAVLEDLTFENVTFTIKGGTRVSGANFGLLAGTVSEGAKVEDVTVSNSTLQIDSTCYFGTTDYCLGLVCGLGTTDIDPAGITCKAVGENPENLSITVNDGVVTLQFSE